MRRCFEPETKVKSYNSKDTKKWCKGKVGRSHICQWEIYHSRATDSMFLMSWIKKCINCGRIVDYYFAPFRKPHESEKDYLSRAYKKFKNHVINEELNGEVM